MSSSITAPLMVGEEQRQHQPPTVSSFIRARRWVVAGALLFVLGMVYSLMVTMAGPALLRLGMSESVLEDLRSAEKWVGLGMALVVLAIIAVAQPFHRQRRLVWFVLAVALIFAAIAGTSLANKEFVGEPGPALAKVAAVLLIAPIMLPFF